MIKRVIYFTNVGEKVKEEIEKHYVTDLILSSDGRKEDAKCFISDGFKYHNPIIFIGALGIAVRMMKDLSQDKLTDSAFIVMDERKKFVIPVLSGHMGGAIELSYDLANKLGSEVVITTATDVEEKFSVDTFARINHLKIKNKEMIKKVSAKVLDGKEIRIAIPAGFKIIGEPWDKVIIQYYNNINDLIDLTERNDKNDDNTICNVDVLITPGSDLNESFLDKVLILNPKNYIFGMGVRKGKTFEEINEFLISNGIDSQWMEDNILYLSSIDLKLKEEGLLNLASFYHTELVTFNAEELAALKGDFKESEFVKETVGVSNVCERAAALLAYRLDDSYDNKLFKEKTAGNGITFAVVKIDRRQFSWR